MASVFRDFIYGLRKIEWETPFLILIREHPPKHLENYIKMLEGVPYDDDKSNAYYGDIKKVMFSFLCFYTSCISQVNDQIDRYTQELKYSEMMKLFNNTVTFCDGRYQAFKRDDQPLDSVAQELQHNIMLSAYHTFKKKLKELGAEIAEIKKPNKIQEFAKAHLPLCIKRTAAMCDYTHVFLSKMLFARVSINVVY